MPYTTLMSTTRHCDTIIALIDRCLEEYEQAVQALPDGFRPLSVAGSASTVTS
jgi:hypothetical protein